ncbi:MAG TPA: delta 1-pyrroline-5-carboxylate synthetase [Methanosphaera sp.]|nr:delta 1-pyrroline-5-carboxylate synthetase [Methanosphaera sp.]HIJ15659.1 delta 1-pyrroline-5-carboxylate synthetase [Methanosphaera sp.]
MVTVVKIGGSLFPEYTEELCNQLTKSNEKTVLINGGGSLANNIREFNKIKHFSDDVNHWNAIKCMDIIGNFIADKNDDIIAITSFDEIEKVHNLNKTPLLLTYELLKKEDPLKHSWEVTSDSIACWIANKLNAKLLILTNVDGIYRGNISSNNKKLIKNIKAKDLLFFKETCIDKCLPKLLIKYHLDCFVINGKYPARVMAHLNSNNNINNFYTYIGGE